MDVVEKSEEMLEEDILDPVDSDMPCDAHRGQTWIHSHPGRLEDEGQSGG